MALQNRCLCKGIAGPAELCIVLIHCGIDRLCTAVQIVCQLVALLYALCCVAAVVARRGHVAFRGGLCHIPIAVSHCELAFLFAIGIGVVEHLAVGPYQFIVQINIRMTVVVATTTAEAKYL